MTPLGDPMGYTCQACGMFVPWNATHACGGPAPVMPAPWPAPLTPGPVPWAPFEYKPTQREYFAARAMQAIATSTSNGWADAKDAGEIGKRAVAIADGLIAALTAYPSDKPGEEQ